ncbi:ABC transporter ATP-binding protein [Lachnospiraceae bacterium MD1]|uniref:ABC transporter ATP-binding protein n=1 Tax=Variimorphobacter saccharofermentans TaxID=2755051 RepID=A0A839K4C1_9FIRM|nr:ABC transporter ATP-binding protein [Variimorphobacter saccharofermentans]MBB2184714.1 ABC transporter ATP-binding protein [Variimorphobacter saccharofermentans]
MKIKRYILKYWYAYLTAILCIVIAVSLDMIYPQVTKQIVDNVIVGRELSLLPRLLIMILIIGIGRCIFQYVKEYVFDLVSARITMNIRRDLFKHIQGLSLSFFDKNNTGELMSRLKDDVDQVWAALGYISMLIIEVAIHTGIALYCMFSLSPSLAVFPTIVLPMMAGLAILMEKKLGKIYEAISEENAKLNTVAQENLSGVRTVKAFAREKFEIKKFLSHNKQYYDLNMKQSKVFIKINPYFQFVTKLLPLIVIMYGGYQVINDKMSLGSLVAFTDYSMNIVWPMEMLGWLSNSFASAIASTKRINKIYQEKPEITEIENPVILDEVKGSIRFDKVSFSLSDKTILSDISFDLGAGKTIGIMGATGTGKSSIINLLQRFYDATEGEIFVDGVNIKELTLKQLRKNISLVMQDVFLFSDTINENVKMGKKNLVSQEDIVNAAVSAQAKEFIDRMDNQFETVVGERGVGLSGGQKQRISIARALAKKTPILVLDDSTSALDMETEHMIQKALTQIDATKIIIAHRISAVRNADEIIILEDGKIMERGTHETLLQKKGYYYDTYMAQYGDYLEVMGSSNAVPKEKEVAVCQ